MNRRDWSFMMERGMTVVARLSSQVGSRSEDGNIGVAQLCLRDPDQLRDIALRLTDRDVQLAGDCAEVMTKVAERNPGLVAPHVDVLYSLLDHKNGRVRWEAAHAVALVAREVPEFIGGKLRRLGEITASDKSVIVRDYVLDAIAAYGATSARAAVLAFPLLESGLTAWESKHAARVLRGLEDVAVMAPRLANRIRRLAEPFEQHSRPGVRKAAKALSKKVGSGT